MLLAASADSASSESRINHGGGNFQSWEGSRVDVNATRLSGANVALTAQGDITSIASEVSADRLTLSTPGRLNLLTATAQENQNRDSRDHDAWFVDGGSVGSEHQSTAYNRFSANSTSISAGSINAQVSVYDSVQTLSQQPGMAWMSQLMSDPALAGQVNWQRVREVHEQWDNSYSGLGPASQAIITVIVAFVTAGAGVGAVGAAAVPAAGTTAAVAGSGIAGSLGLSASATAIASGAAQAGISAIASQATVSFINNNGDIGAVLHELGSSEGIRNIATAMVTGGVTGGLGQAVMMDVTSPNGNVTSTNLNNISLGNGASGLQVLGRNLINNTASAAVGTAINGGDLGDNLTGAVAGGLVSAGAAIGADAIGGWAPSGDTAINALARETAHAILGCAAGAATAAASGGSGSSGCAGGAAGAVVGHLAGQAFNPDPENNAHLRNDTIGIGNLGGGIAGALASGTAQGSHIGAAAGANAVENNYLAHNPNNGRSSQLNGFAQDLARCKTTAGCDVEGVYAYWSGVSRDNQQAASNATATWLDTGDATALGQHLAAAGGAIGANPAAYCSTGDARCYQFIQQQNNQALAVYRDFATLGIALEHMNAPRRAPAPRAQAEASPAAPPATALTNEERVNLSARRDDYQQYDQYRRESSTRVGGEWDWSRMAPNDGAVLGTTNSYAVQAGQLLDRYGARTGSYLAPESTPYDHRSLGPGARGNGYEQYEVARPFTVERSEVAPAFSQAGGGYQIQYRIPEIPAGPASINELIRFGYITPRRN